MFISHQTLQRLLEEAIDEYDRHRVFGNPDSLARERAIEAAMRAAEFVLPAQGSETEAQLELPLTWRTGSAAPAWVRRELRRPQSPVTAAEEEEAL